jgi:predicted amidohydrolase
VAASVRISTIQSRRNPLTQGLCANPFGDGFAQADLMTAINRNLDWFEGLFAQAAADKCQLTVVTEDFTRIGQTAGFLDDPDLFHEAVLRQTPLVAERVGAAARRHKMHIVACYYAQEGELIYNVADLFGPSGDRVGRYRKVHLPQYEKWQVAEGSEFPAFETELGWVGMLICYDQMWPEAAACCALNGAQLICQPSAASLKEHQMLTRAGDSQVHMLSSTYSNSMITSPRGQVLANAADQETAVAAADVDLQEGTVPDPMYLEYLYSGIRDHKERHLKFRRPETYRVLTDPRPPLADQYPDGNVADSPAAIAEVYARHKAMQQQIARGENIDYHWRG